MDSRTHCAGIAAVVDVRGSGYRSERDRGARRRGAHRDNGRDAGHRRGRPHVAATGCGWAAGDAHIGAGRIRGERQGLLGRHQRTACVRGAGERIERGDAA